MLTLAHQIPRGPTWAQIRFFKLPDGPHTTHPPPTTSSLSTNRGGLWVVADRENSVEAVQLVLAKGGCVHRLDIFPQLFRRTHPN